MIVIEISKEQALSMIRRLSVMTKKHIPSWAFTIKEELKTLVFGNDEYEHKFTSTETPKPKTEDKKEKKKRKDKKDKK